MDAKDPDAYKTELLNDEIFKKYERLILDVKRATTSDELCKDIAP